MNNMKKLLILLLCAVTLVAAGVFGTLAYFTDSEAVTNTFTVGLVGLKLDEAHVNQQGQPLKDNAVVEDVEDADRWQPTEQDPEQESGHRRQKREPSQAARLLHGGDQQAPHGRRDHHARGESGHDALQRVVQRPPHEENTASSPDRPGERDQQARHNVIHSQSFLRLLFCF